MRMSWIGLGFAIASILIVSGGASSANAQAPPTLVPRPLVQAKATQQLRSYPIKYATVESIVPAIQTLFGNSKEMRILPHERTNTLIALGTGEAHEKLSELIEAVDVANLDLPSLKVFPLRGAAIQGSARALDLLAIDVDVAVTENSLIVRGGEQEIEQATEVMS